MKCSHCNTAHDKIENRTPFTRTSHIKRLRPHEYSCGGSGIAKTFGPLILTCDSHLFAHQTCCDDAAHVESRAEELARQAFATLACIVKHPNSKNASQAAAPHYFSRYSSKAARDIVIHSGNDEGADDEGADDGIAETNGDEKTSRRESERVRWIEARVRRDETRVLRLATGAGTFARSALDAGSALLLETAALPDAARVLDLGCGWGALGCFCASFSPASRVWMCDINRRAVLLAQGNARENKLNNTIAWRGDGAQAARPDFFDIVLCNPPIRAGNAVIAQLFGDAQRVLKNGGALWVVIRTAQGAKSWQRRLQESFGNCETIAIEGGYRILKSEKQ